MKTTLVSAAELAASLEDPDCVVIDCRFDLGRPGWGEQAHVDGHVPGAVYAHLDRDLSGKVTPATGRHPLPVVADFAGTLGRWGIDGATQVFAYDQANGAYASRLWWMMRSLGHEAVAVLDGGYAAWSEAGLPVANGVGTRPSRQYLPGSSFQPVETTEIAGALGKAAPMLVDARAADRFAGRNETLDAVAGHVPGALNHPFTENLDARGRFLPPADLRARWRKILGGTSAGEVVSMCGSGVTACHNLLALEIAGFAGARLYAGSWSEWIRDPARPVARDHS